MARKYGRRDKPKREKKKPKEEERIEMEKFSNDLNRDFDFATRMRTLTIDKAPAETAMSEFQIMANAALDGIQDEDVTITINTVRNETIRRIYDPFLFLKIKVDMDY